MPPRQRQQRELTGRRKRVRSKQTSWLKPQIDAVAEEADRLQEQLAALEDAKQGLLVRLEDYEQKRLESDAALCQAIVARCALGGAAKRFSHTQARLESSLYSFPPPDQWTPSLLRMLDSLNIEQVRYVTYHSTQDVAALLRDPCKGHDVTSMVQKGVAFILHYVERHPALWNSIRGSNLLTGEPASVPEDWYTRVAEMVPLHMLPDNILARLRDALVAYASSVKGVVARRTRLQQQLRQLLPKCLDRYAGHLTSKIAGKSSRLQQSVQLQVTVPLPPAAYFRERSGSSDGSSKWDSGPSSDSVAGVTTQPHFSSHRGGWAGLQVPPRASAHTSDMDAEQALCKVEQLLEDIEATFTAELHATTLVYPRAFSNSKHVVAFLSATCLPYHSDMACITTALYKRLLSCPKSLARADQADVCTGKALRLGHQLAEAVEAPGGDALQLPSGGIGRAPAPWGGLRERGGDGVLGLCC